MKGLWAASLLVLLPGLEWEGSRARWLRDLSSGDELHRADAVRGLADLPGEEVDAALAQALEDESSEVRRAAAGACEARALHACAATLAEWLDDPDARVRALAARVLGATGGSEDVPRLGRMLGDARPPVRREAVLGLEALGRATGDAAAVRALITALTDADPIVRERAATALAEIAGPAHERGTASTALLGLTRDEAPEVRVAALDALGLLEDPRASSAAVVALEDDVVEVRLAALRALTLAPSSIATPALVRAAEDDERTGRAALAALARTEGPGALDAIVAALSRPAAARSAEDALETRMLASEAARRETIAALAAALSRSATPDQTMRLATTAVRLSSRVSIAGLEPVLLSLLETQPTPALVEALGHTGSDAALVPVLAALGSDAPGMRTAGLSGLEGLAASGTLDGRALDPIVLVMGVLAEDERARAVPLVGAIHSERAVAWLLDRLEDPARAVRIAALVALRDRASSAGTERLARLLEDADAEVRGRAALALAGRAAAGAIDEATALLLAERLASDAPRDRPAILVVLGPLVRAMPEGSARERVRAAILLALASSDEELADAAALAIAASHDPALGRAAMESARGQGPTATARALRAVTTIDLPEARALAIESLGSLDPAVRCAALVTLGEIGGPSELDEIARRVSTLRFPDLATASFALARGTARHAPTATIAHAWEEMARSHDPYVRANVAVAATQRSALEVGGASALDWLAPSMPAVVRVAAAHWARASRAASSEGTRARIDAALAACAADVSQPALARACSVGASAGEPREADVIALGPGERPLPGRLVALRFADASVLVTYSDARARVRLERAPEGPLSLEAPESAVLVP